jgi:MYXO-CTERM domain-containing protein
MDFIERIFGIAPDGGDGSLEALWVLAIAAAAVAWFGRRRLREWLSGRRVR